MEWKTIAKTIRFPYVQYFPVISCVEELGSIHMCVECADSLYPYIQYLVIELNSYMLAVFITERRFAMILY